MSSDSNPEPKAFDASGVDRKPSKYNIFLIGFPDSVNPEDISGSGQTRPPAKSPIQSTSDESTYASISPDPPGRLLLADALRRILQDSDASVTSLRLFTAAREISPSTQSANVSSTAARTLDPVLKRPQRTSSFQINASNQSWTNSSTFNKSSLEEEAKKLLQKLDGSIKATESVENSDVVLVAYGFGGVIIKEALLQANTTPEYNHIAIRVAHIAFFGTPHRARGLRHWKEVLYNVLKEDRGQKDFDGYVSTAFAQKVQALSFRFANYHAKRFKITNFLDQPELNKTGSDQLMAEIKYVGTLSNDSFEKEITVTSTSTALLASRGQVDMTHIEVDRKPESFMKNFAFLGQLQDCVGPFAVLGHDGSNAQASQELMNIRSSYCSALSAFSLIRGSPFCDPFSWELIDLVDYDCQHWETLPPAQSDLRIWTISQSLLPPETMDSLKLSWPMMQRHDSDVSRATITFLVGEMTNERTSLMIQWEYMIRQFHYPTVLKLSSLMLHELGTSGIAHNSRTTLLLRAVIHQVLSQSPKIFFQIRREYDLLYRKLGNIWTTTVLWNFLRTVLSTLSEHGLVFLFQDIDDWFPDATVGRGFLTKFEDILSSLDVRFSFLISATSEAYIQFCRPVFDSSHENDTTRSESSITSSSTSTLVGAERLSSSPIEILQAEADSKPFIYHQTIDRPECVDKGHRHPAKLKAYVYLNRGASKPDTLVESLLELGSFELVQDTESVLDDQSSLGAQRGSSCNESESPPSENSADSLREHGKDASTSETVECLESGSAEQMLIEAVLATKHEPLKRFFSRGIHSQEARLAALTLQWIAYAKRPLQLSELTTAISISWRLGDGDSSSYTSPILALIAESLPLYTVYSIHRMRELVALKADLSVHLSDSCGLRPKDLVSLFHGEPSQTASDNANLLTEKDLTICCLEYLENHNQSAAHFSDIINATYDALPFYRPDQRSPVIDYKDAGKSEGPSEGFFSYAARHWFVHYKAASRLDSSESTALDKRVISFLLSDVHRRDWYKNFSPARDSGETTIKPQQEELESDCVQMDPYEPDSDYRGLEVASFLGLRRIVKELIKPNIIEITTSINSSITPTGTDSDDEATSNSINADDSNSISPENRSKNDDSELVAHSTSTSSPDSATATTTAETSETSTTKTSENSASDDAETGDGYGATAGETDNRKHVALRSANASETAPAIVESKLPLVATEKEELGELLSVEEKQKLSASAERALDWAILNGHQTIADLLIQEGAVGNHALSLLARQDFADTTTMLLNSEALLKRLRKPELYSASSCAARAGNSKTLEALFASPLISEFTNDEWESLIVSATVGGNQKALLCVISNAIQASPAFDKTNVFQYRDKSTKSLLMLAAELGHLEIVRLLVEGGADPALGDQNGKTALHYAVRSDLAVIQYLLDNPANGSTHTAPIQLRMEDLRPDAELMEGAIDIIGYRYIYPRTVRFLLFKVLKPIVLPVPEPITGSHQSDSKDSSIRIGLCFSAKDKAMYGDMKILEFLDRPNNYNRERLFELPPQQVEISQVGNEKQELWRPEFRNSVSTATSIPVNPIPLLEIAARLGPEELIKYYTAKLSEYRKSNPEESPNIHTLHLSSSSAVPRNPSPVEIAAETGQLLRFVTLFREVYAVEETEDRMTSQDLKRYLGQLLRHAANSNRYLLSLYLLGDGALLTTTTSGGFSQSSTKWTPQASEKWTPLMLACANGFVELVKLFLAHENLIGTTSYSDCTDTYGRSALHLAIIHGMNVDIINELLRDEVIAENLVDLPDNAEETPLHMAAGNATVSEILLRNGADYYAEDGYFGRTPIIYSVVNSGNDPAAMLLFLHWYEEELEEDDLQEVAADLLHHAVKGGFDKLVDELFRIAPDLLKSDQFTFCPIGPRAFKSAVKRRNAVIIRKLVEKGVPIDGKRFDHKGTELHRAADLGYEDMVRLLIELGAEVDAQDESTRKRTPLYIAVFRGHRGCVEALLENNADANKYCEDVTPLHIVPNDPEIVTMLIEKGKADPEAMTLKTKRTILMEACSAGFVKVVQRLIRSHAVKLDATGGAKEKTALHYAVDFSTNPDDAEAIVQLLLDAGANAELKDADGFTAFHYAEADQNDRLIDQFLAAQKPTLEWLERNCINALSVDTSNTQEPVGPLKRAEISCAMFAEGKSSKELRQFAKRWITTRLLPPDSYWEGTFTANLSHPKSDHLLVRGDSGASDNTIRIPATFVLQAVPVANQEEPNQSLSFVLEGTMADIKHIQFTSSPYHYSYTLTIPELLERAKQFWANDEDLNGTEPEPTVEESNELEGSASNEEVEPESKPPAEELKVEEQAVGADDKSTESLDNVSKAEMEETKTVEGDVANDSIKHDESAKDGPESHDNSSTSTQEAEVEVETEDPDSDSEVHSKCEDDKDSNDSNTKSDIDADAGKNSDSSASASGTSSDDAPHQPTSESETEKDSKNAESSSSDSEKDNDAGEEAENGGTTESNEKEKDGPGDANSKEKEGESKPVEERNLPDPVEAEFAAVKGKISAMLWTDFSFHLAPSLRIYSGNDSITCSGLFKNSEEGGSELDTLEGEWEMKNHNFYSVFLVNSRFAFKRVRISQDEAI